MIIHEKLDKPYDQYKKSHLVWVRCDYCGKELQREKRSIIIGNKNIDKDSCKDTKCRDEKKIDVSMKLYGVPFHILARPIRDKSEKTNLEKFGTKEYFGSPDAIEKTRYGVTSYSSTPEFLERVKKTNLEKYGVEFIAQSTGFQEKVKKTSLEKYGVENYSQTQEAKDQLKKTFQEKYGVNHQAQIPSVREKAKKTSLERYGVEYYSQTQESKDRYKETCLNSLGVPSPLCLSENKPNGKAQNSILDWLNSLGIDFISNDYTILGTKEIDMYSIINKFAIEYTGLYWHSSKFKHNNEHYHYEKYINCLKQDVKLITMFEDEWITKQDICKVLLKQHLGLIKSQMAPCKP